MSHPHASGILLSASSASVREVGCMRAEPTYILPLSCLSNVQRKGREDYMSLMAERPDTTPYRACERGCINYTQLLLHVHSTQRLSYDISLECSREHRSLAASASAGRVCLLVGLCEPICSDIKGPQSACTHSAIWHTMALARIS